MMEEQDLVDVELEASKETPDEHDKGDLTMPDIQVNGETVKESEPDKAALSSSSSSHEDLDNANLVKEQEVQPDLEQNPKEAELLNQIASLERERDEARRSESEKGHMIETLKAEHSLALEEAAVRYRLLHEETSAKIEELKRQYTTANRDKEAMVMKYALGEKEVIVQRRRKEELEKKLKNVTKERDDNVQKVKTLMADKVRMQQLADSRLQDISVLKREIEKWKEEVKVQEAKACVANSRLKNELDSHRETKEQLDKTIKHLSETRQEIETTRKECVEFMQRIKSEDDEQKKKAKASDIEKSARLIIDKAAATELEGFRLKHSKLTEENNSLNQKVQRLEKEKQESESIVRKLKETIEEQKEETCNLLAQIAEMEDLRMNLQQSEEKCRSGQLEIDRLREENDQFSKELNSLRESELNLTELKTSLTEKNTHLQADLSSIEAKASALENEYSRLVENVGRLESELSQVNIELTKERKSRKEDNDFLSKQLAEKTEQLENFHQRVVDAENEVLVQKKKNASGLRELTRELMAAKKQLEAKSSNENTMQPVSRNSSESSLNRLNGDERISIQNVPEECNGKSRRNSPSPLADKIPEAIMPDSQVLIEKIVNLQRSMAKQQEKIDFMEEHINTLLEEVKKKSKIIQHYALTAETGALVSAERDNVKLPLAADIESKQRKMSETGGIMASLYSSKPNDSGMTLELSLEINQKLQSVLEDTLLKNITLKENLNTLGLEISKLSSKEGK